MKKFFLLRPIYLLLCYVAINNILFRLNDVNYCSRWLYHTPILRFGIWISPVFLLIIFSLLVFLLIDILSTFVVVCLHFLFSLRLYLFLGFLCILLFHGSLSLSFNNTLLLTIMNENFISLTIHISRVSMNLLIFGVLLINDIF